MTNSSPLNPPSELNLRPPSPNTEPGITLATFATGGHESAVSRQSTPRTPAQIIAALDHCRQRIQSGFDERANKQRDHPSSLCTVLLSVLSMAQDYVQRYLQSALSASTTAAEALSVSRPITQSLLPLLRSTAARPLWVGVGVGMAILIGPKRLVGWCGKAITLYRLALLVKSH